MSAQDVQFKDSFFFIDGQKFFVKGIGYEVGATPGVVPWNHSFDSAIMTSDIERILSGGFNTIRTWAPLTAQELDLLSQFDVKIIMGIWIDPHGDFSNPGFVTQAKTIVTDVLSYSKDYNNIIAYLIMNEPLPETISAAGYDATVALWTQLIDIIHNMHPDRPVSIANTSNGTYIDPAVFDFSAYNVYIYNPVTVNYLHGYRDYIRYLQTENVSGRPLIITEFGLSVSPSGPGNWGYGGNSLDEQQAGILHMYSSLVDGGAAGACVFNYSDGWWKGGNEYVHDNQVEEWFGLVEYSDLSDQYGHVRPVWNTVKAYQSAIITQPKSAEIYPATVPIEIFIDDTIDHIDIYENGDLMHQYVVSDNYILDTLIFSVQYIRDVNLVFRCYDVLDNIVKEEAKQILLSAVNITLPTIDMTLLNEDYWESGNLQVRYHIDRGTFFTTGSRLDYAYYPHVGFDYGQSYSWTMPNMQEVDYDCQHFVLGNVDVFTVGAAIEISYNTFSKRIVTQLTRSRINTPVTVNSVQGESPDVNIYPNPTTDYCIVTYSGSVPVPGFDYTIYDAAGNILSYQEYAPWNTHLQIRNLSPGLYFMKIRLPGKLQAVVRRIIKY